MKNLLKLSSFLTILLLLSCKEPAFDRVEMLSSIADKLIVPSFTNFESEAKSLKEALNKFQTAPSEENFIHAQKQWKKTAIAWRKCDLYNLGNFRDAYISNRINTSPTKEKYITRYVLGTDKINTDFVRTKGSNVVGLSAIELLLFNENIYKAFTPEQKIRSQKYLASLGEALYIDAQTASKWWSPSESTYKQLTHSQDTDLSSGISMLLNEMIALTEKILITKLGKPLGKHSDGKSYPELLEAFYSGQSLEHIDANLSSIKDTYYGGSGIGLDDYLIHLEENSPLAKKIEAQLSAADNAIKNIPTPLKKTLLENRQSVEAAYEEIRKLLILLKVDAANKLAITVTFNDNDGD